MAVPQHPARNEYFEDDADEQLLGKQRAPLEEMPTTDFESSNVHSALYDFGERECYIRYLRRDGADAIYRYDNFPARQWQALVEASSKGSIINAEIAYDYNYVRINRGSMPTRDPSAYGDQRVRRFVMTP
jgi:hypothetical protein